MLRYRPRKALLGALSCALLTPPAVVALAPQPAAAAQEIVLPPPPPALERLKYNNPDLTVDLGVGLWAWPLPMDVDGDGTNDLLVNSPDAPFNGVWYFRNTGSNSKPLFAEPVRLSEGKQNSHISHVDGKVYVTTPGRLYPNVKETGLTGGEAIPFDGVVHEPDVPGGSLRGVQWHMVDYNGNGALDIVVGVGDWSEYGSLAEAADAWNDKGEWTNGPLHGYVYLIENRGTTEQPVYADPVKIEAVGKPIDVYGAPTPVVADFTGDRDLDIITGEFLDTPLFFDNVGSRTAPEYAAGRPIPLEGGGTLAMDLQMIVVTAMDWTKDGHVDLVIGEEDGRVSLVENTGTLRDGLPVFKKPAYFQQKAEYVKVGALSTPSAVDWDGDGRQDLIVGDTAGRLSFVKNLGGDGDTPTWAAPQRLSADGKEIRHQAGFNGSIQGPSEAKWGYTAPVVADWNHDGLPDIVVNDIWGKVTWYENVGTRTSPQLAARQPVEVAWDGPAPKPKWNWWNPAGTELVTQWRTTPFVVDLNKDGLTDLVMLDHDGYLAYFERTETDGKLTLLPGKRIFIGEQGSSKFNRNGVPQASAAGPLQMNQEINGGSGRRKFTMLDWTGDGRLDIIGNGDVNVRLLENVGTGNEWRFRDAGAVSNGRLVGHDTAPTAVNWDGRKEPALLISAEDGHLYYQRWNYGATLPERRPQPQGDLADLVGSWDLNEGTGHVATDDSGYGNHGTVDGAAWTPGHTGSGLTFDAFNDYVDLSYTVGPHLHGASGITFSAWVNPHSMQNGAQRLFGTRINGGTAGFEVTFENSNGQARIAVAGRSRAPGDSYRKLVFDAATIRPRQWHHVAAMLDFEHNTVRLYVDGVERADVSDSGHRFSSDRYGFGRPTQPDSIGRSPDGSSYFRGSIDDVRIHRVALGQREILLDVLTAEVKRYIAAGSIKHQMRDPLTDHLSAARGHLANGRYGQAREQLEGTRNLLAGVPGEKFVDADVRSRLLSLIREYLLRADPPTATAAPCPPEPTADSWVSTWQTALSAPRLANSVAKEGFADQTLRMVMRTTAGGCSLRVRLSNEFGNQDVTFNRVTVGLHAGGGRLVPGTVHELRFAGKESITAAPGSEVVSDRVPLATGERQELAVSVYVAGPTGQATTHNLARETGFVSAGDHTADLEADALRPVSKSWMFVSGVEVKNVADRGSIVAVGDSLTDGLGSTVGAEKTWPDQLADRLLQPPGSGGVSVVNNGIAAGRLLRDAPPSEPDPQSLPGGLARLDRDLAGDDVSAVILYLGINDIIQSRQLPDQAVTAADLIEGYRDYIRRSHAHGVQVVGATLTPYGSSRNWTAAGEAIRQEVNQWIRTSGEFDAVVDFDAAVRDPNDPVRIDRRYDYRDGLHFNDAGYLAMAEAIDLNNLH